MHVLSRPRITALFDHAFESSVVVLHAGPGFGKTTALARYLEQAGTTAVWFSCASYDNEPTGFWEHLTRVFSQHKPKLKEQMEALGFPDTLQKFSRFISDLTQELYHDENAVAFVFDDVDIITESEILIFLKNFADARLENCSFVLLTQVWPLFNDPLSVVPQVIDGVALSYTQEETKTYLHTKGIVLPREELDQIQHYLAGWPIAVSLVAQGVLNTGLEETLEQSLPKPSLFALLEEQIFSGYSDDEQSALIKISVLESFPEGLVRAVTSEYTSDLARLLNDSAFVKYDATAKRFSFHALYLEFLREKLRDVSEEDLSQSYLRAGEWCLENGYYYDAVRYYRDCENYEKLWEALMLMRVTRRSFSSAEFFIEQIEALPESFKKENPMTELMLAMVLVNNLRFDESRQVLDELDARLPHDDSSIRGEYYLVRGLFTVAHEELDFVEYFKKAADLLPQGSSRWNSDLQLIDLGPAIKLYRSEPGELEKSFMNFKKAAPSMVIAMKGAGCGIDHLAESEVLFLQGELQRVLEPAYQALYSATGVGQFDIAGNALFLILRVYFAQGKYDQFLDTMEHVDRYREDPQAQSLGIWDIVRGWFFSEMGQIENIALWIRNPVQGGYSPLSLDRPMVIRMRCLIASNQYSEALALINQIEALSTERNLVTTLINMHVGRAMAYLGLARYDESAVSLSRAYELARGNSIYMPFIEYGNRARTLFERIRKSSNHDMPKEWLDEMFSKSSTFAKRQAYIVGRYREDTRGGRIDFGLSTREAELLINISQGLTRNEIAEEMNLSINTVKSLTKQLFGKLGAINAADAVRIGSINKLI